MITILFKQNFMLFYPEHILGLLLFPMMVGLEVIIEIKCY